ncbi:MAG TPA: glutamine synthetase family protein [Trueperaceae bacterium]|nr:glutamine synthetase family protein [Trueperaceae bacterium]
MTLTHGTLSLEELAEEARRRTIDTVLVAFPDPYGRLMGKRFDAEYFVARGAAHGTHVCDYLLTADMEMEPVQGYRFASWQLGYGDVLLRPDLSTLRRATWLDRSALVLCDVLPTDETGGGDVAIAPRSMLRRQIASAGAAGFTVQAASELEYYVFEDSFRQAAEAGYTGLTPMGWYLEDYHLLQGTREERFTAELRRHLRDSGVPVENSKGEWGRGQHELNVAHAEALAMADRHTVLKQAAKEIAERLGVSVTYMAKPAAGQAGSSCHVHLSLWRDGTNAFDGDEKLGPVAGSDVFRHFLAGWMAHADELMVLYAPTVNSYKRFEDGSWAPTRAAWSFDNRTAGFRVVGKGQSLRIECRIPGADVNPYLAFAAALASGLDGVERRLEPEPMVEGDIYGASSLPRLPRSLAEAVARFEASPFAREALGEDVVEHYAHFYRSEQAAFDAAVTDWERQRYFERI